LQEQVLGLPVILQQAAKPVLQTLDISGGCLPRSTAGGPRRFLLGTATLRTVVIAEQAGEGFAVFRPSWRGNRSRLLEDQFCATDDVLAFALPRV